MIDLTENAGITYGTKIHIQKELECITEAMAEYHIKANDERKAVILEEVVARAWAAIYLIQYADGVILKPPEYNEILREAKAYDFWGPESQRADSGLFDDEDKTEGLHS